MSCSIIAVNELSEQDITTMYLLANSFYENIDPKDFLRGLADKDYCAIIRDELGELVGFQTQQLLHISNGSRDIHGFFSEDMITLLDTWNEEIVVKEIMDFYSEAMDEYDEFFWYLICKDYRTYRLMTRQFKEYYPNSQSKNQMGLKQLVNSFGRFFFMNEFDDKQGIIRYKYFRRKPNITREQRKVLQQSEPDAAVFMFYNPYFYKGNDLVCVTKLNKK